MKRFLKWFLLVAAIGITIVVGYLYLSPDKNINGLYLVPSDAFYILESDDPISDWKTMSESDVWTFLKQHPEFKDITDDANYLDQLIQDNNFLFKLFGSRKFILSAHQTRPADYDFLFAIDLKRTAKAGILYNTLEKTLKSGGYKVTFRKYGDYELLESMDNMKDVLTMCKIENFLVCSYTPSLVEKSIDEWGKSADKLARDIYFQDVYKRVKTKGIGRLYIQYSRIDEMMKCYMSEPNDLINGLSTSLRFTALDLKSEGDFWRVDGYSNINEGTKSYLRALMRSGTSKHLSSDILPNRTAYYLSFNFSSMDKFYNELNEVFKQDQKAYADFQKSQKRLENLLGISVQDQLLSWISDEVTVAQMRSNDYTQRQDNLVVCLHSNDIGKARKELNKVAQQVKRRTPAKFKRIEYRNYEIQYLDIKGFFRTFFGKAFEKLEKPYFTIIGDYVVFSNSPLTLIGVIEDYENFRTLSLDPAYKRFLENGSSSSSLTLYISPKNTYPLMTKYANSETRKSLAKSKMYFEGFEGLALQLTPKGDLIDTKAYLHRTVETTAQPELVEKVMVEKYQDYAVVAIDTQFAVELIEDGIFKKYFPDGQHLRIEADMKNGELHGRYTEFYLNGKEHITGKYKRGKKTGTWKTYDLSGDVIEKERY
ncbi:MAG: DUF3352 domain-containing protein [Flavobacteriales bacterium]|nr:DUF3352 domain-containing protein [Bacteroidota bacterium]MCB9240705.1 DUF3352 domain-containing protein [Flavobacteriales bacterium]